MSEYDMLFEDEAGQGIFDWLDQAWKDGAIIVGDDPTMIGGRGAFRKTHIGAIDAVHRALGNIHSHSKIGRDFRKTGSAAHRPSRPEQQSQDT